MTRIIDHFYILATIVFTVYSQLMMRWQVSAAGDLPADGVGKSRFIIGLLLNPWVISGILATFCAGVSWMLAMTRFEISYAYPFISLNYILVIGASILFFNEAITLPKIAGTLLVIIGVIVISKG